jgi:hypothetical protein
MSKNTNLSFLTDYITADITNGRIGINNASPTVAFDVSGATKISGVLTLTSTISNGTYTYTLPSATGTLALTSALSGYLPLTGGTLTGTLTGTSATFIGGVGIGSPPAQAAQFDLFGGDQAGLLTYSGFGNRSGSDLLINSYRLPNVSLFQRVSDIVSLGDDVNGRESIIRFITTNTSNATNTKLTISGSSITASVLSTFVNGATVNDVFKIYSLTTSLGVVLQGYTGGLRIAVNGSEETGGARGDLLAAAADFSSTLAVTGAATFLSSISATSATFSGDLTVNSNFPATFNVTSTANSATYGGVTINRQVNTVGNGNGLAFAMYNSVNASAEYAYIGTIIETNTSTSQNGAIIFAPTYLGARTERMRITSAGNVGIGTSSPTSFASTTFQVNGSSSSASIKLTNTTTGAGNANGLDILQSTTDTYIFNRTTGMMVFGTSETERMRILSTGQVLVGGTSSDGYGFQVYGATSLNGQVKFTQVTANSGFVNETLAVNGSSASYFLNKDTGANNGSSTTTFNIIGLSNAAGTIAHITLRVSKAATASAINTVAYVQINGVDMIGELFVTGTGAGTTIKSFTVVYNTTTGWQIIGAVGTY